LLKLLPLSIKELLGRFEAKSIDKFLLTGFYPRIYDQALNPTRVYGDYFETYVERDLRGLAAIKDLGLFEKFVKLCAGRVGQILNLHSLANDVGVSHTTARSWMTILEASYIVFLLPPYFRNISKRLIKTPKLYFHDVGLASFLLGLESESQVRRDPLRGNLFENMAVIEALKFRFNAGKKSNLSFYRDSTGNEVDLILEYGRGLFPVEIKAGTTINEDFFKGLKSFAKVVSERPFGMGIIYGGESVETRGDTRIFPVGQLGKMIKDVEEARG